MIALACVVILAIGLFLILKPGDDSEDSNNSATTPVATAPTGSSGTVEPKPEPKPAIPSVSFQDGQPKGGVLDLQVDQGETVRFRVESDVPEEVHVHGYDISSEVGPGKPARFDFKADIPGIYEIEMEVGGIPIAELEVTP